MRYLILSIFFLLSFTQVHAQDRLAAIEGGIFLAKVLKTSFQDGGYTVVAPLTDISHLDPKAFNDDYKKNLLSELQIEGEDISKLLDSLLETNRTPVKLLMPSSPENGYLIDFEGKFSKYFQKGGGGWQKWYEENPQAHGFTTVSLPAYDSTSGLVLVYKGTQSHYLAGEGGLIIYRYKDGELIELKRATMWVS